MARRGILPVGFAGPDRSQPVCHMRNSCVDASLVVLFAGGSGLLRPRLRNFSLSHFGVLIISFFKLRRPTVYDPAVVLHRVLSAKRETVSDCEAALRAEEL